MAIQERPLSYRQHYKMFQESNKEKKRVLEEQIKDLKLSLDNLKPVLESNKQYYKDTINVDLDKIKDYKEGEYVTGWIKTKVNKSIMMADFNHPIYCLFLYAKTIVDVYKLEQELEFVNKLLAYSIYEYTDILKLFYTQVHKAMILDGCAYSPGFRLGYFIIIRAKNRGRRLDKRIDYQATKELKKKIIAEGKRPYNKEEAKWCEENGIEYDGVDYKVNFYPEYITAISNYQCTLPNASSIRFVPSNYITAEFKKYTWDDFIERFTKEEICELNISIQHKLNMCLRKDNILYAKYIRNETESRFNNQNSNAPIQYIEGNDYYSKENVAKRTAENAARKAKDNEEYLHSAKIIKPTFKLKLKK